MDYSNINKALCSFIPVNEKDVINDCIKVKGLSLLKLRDILVCIGEIRHEDLENQFYVSFIRGGFLKLNHATILTELIDDNLIVAAYATEGIFFQHTCKGAINELRNAIKRYTDQC